jgi:hypothetical protein
MRLRLTDQRLGPFTPFALALQYNVPTGKLIVGVYVEGTTVAFTVNVVKEELVETWMV